MRRKPNTSSHRKYETNNSLSISSINSLYREYKYFGVSDFSNPRTLTMIKNLQADPFGHFESMIDLSWLMYNTNGSVRNTIDNMVAMPTLDSVVVSYGKNKSRNNKNKL